MEYIFNMSNVSIKLSTVYNNLSINDNKLNEILFKLIGYKNIENPHKGLIKNLRRLQAYTLFIRQNVLNMTLIIEFTQYYILSMIIVTCVNMAVGSLVSPLLVEVNSLLISYINEIIFNIVSTIASTLSIEYLASFLSRYNEDNISEAIKLALMSLGFNLVFMYGTAFTFNLIFDSVRSIIGSFIIDESTIILSSIIPDLIVSKIEDKPFDYKGDLIMSSVLGVLQFVPKVEMLNMLKDNDKFIISHLSHKEEFLTKKSIRQEDTPIDRYRNAVHEKKLEENQENSAIQDRRIRKIIYNAGKNIHEKTEEGEAASVMTVPHKTTVSLIKEEGEASDKKRSKSLSSLKDIGERFKRWSGGPISFGKSSERIQAGPSSLQVQPIPISGSYEARSILSRRTSLSENFIEYYTGADKNKVLENDYFLFRSYLLNLLKEDINYADFDIIPYQTRVSTSDVHRIYQQLYHSLKYYDRCTNFLRDSIKDYVNKLIDKEEYGKYIEKISIYLFDPNLPQEYTPYINDFTLISDIFRSIKDGTNFSVQFMGERRSLLEEIWTYQNNVSQGNEWANKFLYISLSTFYDIYRPCLREALNDINETEFNRFYESLNDLIVKSSIYYSLILDRSTHWHDIFFENMNAFTYNLPFLSTNVPELTYEDIFAINCSDRANNILNNDLIRKSVGFYNPTIGSLAPMGDTLMRVCEKLDSINLRDVYLLHGNIKIKSLYSREEDPYLPRVIMQYFEANIFVTTLDRVCTSILELTSDIRKLSSNIDHIVDFDYYAYICRNYGSGKDLLFFQNKEIFTFPDSLLDNLNTILTSLKYTIEHIIEEGYLAHIERHLENMNPFSQEEVKRQINRNVIRNPEEEGESSRNPEEQIKNIEEDKESSAQEFIEDKDKTS